MKTSFASTVLLALAAWSLSANAQEAEESAIVETAITALEDGDAVSARRVISSVEGFGGGEQLFWTPSEAIAALSGCHAERLDVLPVGPRHMFLYRWDCGRRSYSGGIAANDTPQSVRLMYITEGDGAATMLRQVVSMALSPPVQFDASSPEARIELDRRREEHRRELNLISLRKGERFAQLLVDGDIETLAAGVNEYSTVSYGFYNPAASEIFIEMNGMDSQALVAQVERMYSTLGVPIGFACDIGDRETECTWQFVNPDVELNAFINGCCTDRWLIGRIRFAYSTPEARAGFGLPDD